MSVSGWERLDALRDAALEQWPGEASARAAASRRDPALIETHISWVLLVGDLALKVKKPLRLPFLDFSTLAQRREACQDELRLNRRFAPEIYRAVVAITDAGQITHWPSPAPFCALSAASKGTSCAGTPRVRVSVTFVGSAIDA